MERGLSSLERGLKGRVLIEGCHDLRVIKRGSVIEGGTIDAERGPALYFLIDVDYWNGV